MQPGFVGERERVHFLANWTEVCLTQFLLLEIFSRSPTSSLPLVMHLVNGQTMPVLPGPPVQMPSVISVMKASSMADFDKGRDSFAPLQSIWGTLICKIDISLYLSA